MLPILLKGQDEAIIWGISSTDKSEVYATAKVIAKTLNIKVVD